MASARTGDPQSGSTKEFREENFAVEDKALELSYFETELTEDNPQFWARLGLKPDLRDKFVLELGSGHGALSIDAAFRGARRVIGLDLISSRVAFANRVVETRFPQFKGRVEFRKANIQDLVLDEPVDIVLSKDTFEHIMDIDGVLDALARLLKPGGSVYVGIGPFYSSPYGDHGLHAIGKRRKFPWMHLIMGDRRVVASYNKHHPGVTCKTVYDMGMNKLRLNDFVSAFKRHGFKIANQRVNASEGGSKLYPLLGLLRRLPVVGLYTTVNIYAQFILENLPPGL